MNDSQHNQQNPPPVNVQQGRTKQTKKPKGRIEPQDPFTDFESSLASYGNLFFPPPPPPKTPSGTRLGLIFLASFAVMGFVIGFLTLNGVLGISQHTSTLATAVAELPSSSAPQTASEPVDLSSLEAQLDEIKQNNADLLARLGEIEILLQSGPQVNSQPVTPEATPSLEATAITSNTSTQTKNRLTIKKDATIRLVPSLVDNEHVATFLSDKQISVWGKFTDRNGTEWIVFKPFPNMNLNINQNLTSDDDFYSRKYVFVQLTDSFIQEYTQVDEIVSGITSFEMTLIVERAIWCKPEDRADNNNDTKEIATRNSGMVKVLGAFTKDDDQWIAIEWEQGNDTSVNGNDNSTSCDIPVAYIFWKGADNNDPFSPSDLNILATMPDYSP